MHLTITFTSLLRWENEKSEVEDSLVSPDTLEACDIFCSFSLILSFGLGTQEIFSEDSGVE
jgi:hypothetical protein